MKFLTVKIVKFMGYNVLTRLQRTGVHNKPSYCIVLYCILLYSSIYIAPLNRFEKIKLCKYGLSLIRNSNHIMD